MRDTRFQAIFLSTALAIALVACNRQEATAPTEPAPIAPPDLTRLSNVATNDIGKDPVLGQIALAAGTALYDANCASCHGGDAKGTPDSHTPNLTDNEWLYSGDDSESGGLVHTAADVEKLIRYGIRSEHPTTRKDALMPALGMNGMKILADTEIADVTEYTLLLGKQAHDDDAAARGATIWEEKGACWDCHGQNGGGNQAIGATDLTRPSLYLYGASREAISISISLGRAGTSPAFEGKLTEEEIKALAVYVFSLGGPGTL